MSTNEKVLRVEGTTTLAQIERMTADGARISIHYRVTSDGMRPKLTTDYSLAKSAFEATVSR